MRAAIYLRVSTDEQTTDNQEREWLDHWKPAYRLLVVGAGAAELTHPPRAP